jgi:hypothetical protein
MLPHGTVQGGLTAACTGLSYSVTCDDLLLVFTATEAIGTR